MSELNFSDFNSMNIPFLARQTVCNEKHLFSRLLHMQTGKYLSAQSPSRWPSSTFFSFSCRSYWTLDSPRSYNGTVCLTPEVFREPTPPVKHGPIRVSWNDKRTLEGVDKVCLMTENSATLWGHIFLLYDQTYTCSETGTIKSKHRIKGHLSWYKKT